jgi:uncharacterized protein YqeY
MSLQAQIQDDLTAALRAGDEDRKRTLRLLIAALHNAEIAERGALSEEAALAIVRKQAKQRQDAIADFERGNRPDLVAREQVELDILGAYLPPALDEAALEAAAREVIAATGATGPADMGKVMSPLMQRLGGQADGRQVSAVVRRLLAG